MIMKPRTNPPCSTLYHLKLLGMKYKLKLLGMISFCETTEGQASMCRRSLRMTGSFFLWNDWAKRYRGRRKQLPAETHGAGAFDTPVGQDRCLDGVSARLDHLSLGTIGRNDTNLSLVHIATILMSSPTIPNGNSSGKSSWPPCASMPRRSLPLHDRIIFPLKWPIETTKIRSYCNGTDVFANDSQRQPFEQQDLLTPCCFNRGVKRRCLDGVAARPDHLSSDMIERSDAELFILQRYSCCRQRFQAETLPGRAPDPPVVKTGSSFLWLEGTTEILSCRNDIVVATDGNSPGRSSCSPAVADTTGETSVSHRARRSEKNAPKHYLGWKKISSAMRSLNRELEWNAPPRDSSFPLCSTTPENA